MRIFLIYECIIGSTREGTSGISTTKNTLS
jgi:hypothetical protein